MTGKFKVLSILLTATLLIVSFCACGGGNQQGDIIESSPGMENESADIPETESGSDANETSFTVTDIISTDEIKLIAREFNPNGDLGPTLELYLENNTDKTLMYSIEDASVNGFMCDPFWAVEVAPGKKANEQVSWPTSLLEKSGINYVDEIEFEIRVYDSDNWDTEDLFNDVISLDVINTTNEPPNEDVTFEDGLKETELASTDEIKVIAKGFDPNGEWGPALVLYLENNTDKTLMYSIEDAAVNGFMIDPFWATEMAPGKKAYSEVSWLTTALEENDITQMEEIEFAFRVYYSDDFMAEDILNDVFTLTITN